MRIRNLFDKNETYLIAVSGGPDSMALWDKLLKLNLKLIAVHVNYHYRKEADNETLMVKEFARLNNCDIEIFDAHYQGSKGNFESWARKVRYQFFYEIGKKYNVDGCIVGHHLDDYLETYFMQERRGYVSYYGIKNITNIQGLKIIRPCLKVTKERLLRYCKENKIPYAIDVTNYDEKYLRNMIRHQKVMKMSCFEKRKLYRLIELKNKELLGLINKAKKYLNVNNVYELRQLEKEVLDRVIIYKINAVDKRINVSNGLLDEVRNLIKEENGNRLVSIGKIYDIAREYDSLRIVKKNVYNYKIEVKEPQVIETQYFRIDLIKNPESLYIKNDSYPLIIQNAYYPHKIKIGKMLKRVNRLLIDAKIPYTKRLYWPEIVNNKGEVIFIPRTCEDENGLFVVKEL